MSLLFPVLIAQRAINPPVASIAVSLPPRPYDTRRKFGTIALVVRLFERQPRTSRHTAHPEHRTIGNDYLELLNDRISGVELLIVMVLVAILIAPFSCWRTQIEQRQTLNVSVFGDPPHFKNLKKIASDFERDHNNIRVVLDHTYVGEEYKTKVLASAQAGAATDVIYLHWSMVTEIASKNTLLPLDDLIEHDNYDMDDYFPGSTEAYTYNGRLYGIPFKGSTMVLFYNKDLFDAEGLAYPNDDWTWKEFLDAAIRLTKYEGGRVIQIGCIPYDPASWIWSGGGNYGSDDLDSLSFTDPRTIQAIQFFVDLRNKYKVTPRKMDLKQADITRVNVFESGRVGMEVAGPWKLQVYAPIRNLNWDVALFPKGPAGRQTRYAGTGYAISSTTTQKDIAWKYVKHLCGVETANLLAKELDDLPARRSVAYSDVFLREDYGWNMKTFLRAMEPDISTIRIFPRSVYWGWVKQRFDEHLEQAGVNNEDISLMMRQVEQMTQEHIAERKRADRHSLTD